MNNTIYSASEGPMIPKQYMIKKAPIYPPILEPPQPQVPVPKPEMETKFKSIYYEFFSPEVISNLPIKMSESNKKYTADEILLILKTIHSFAYFVVDSMFKRFDRGIDVFKDKEHKEIYDSVKYNNEYAELIEILNNPKTTKQEIIDLINKKDLERISIQKFLNNSIRVEIRII